jgi:outer membrane protein assembly factor BamA
MALRQVSSPLLVGSALLGLLMGQAPATLVKVEVRGAERTGAQAVIDASGLRAGASIDKAAIAAAAQRLMETGRFERVDWKYEPGEAGWTVIFTVREAPEIELAPAETARPVIGDIGFQGTEVIPAERLRAALADAMRGRTWDEKEIRELLDTLLKPLYAEQGYWEARVAALRAAGTPAVTLTVVIEEGERSRLGAVTVNEADPQWVKAAAFPAEGEPAGAKALNAALGRLRAAARGDGYLGVALRRTDVAGGGVLRVKVDVDRGPRFTFGELKIEGLDAAAEKRARKLWALKAGAPMNPGAVEAWMRAVFSAHIAGGTGAERQIVPREGEAVADVIVRFR